MDTYDTVVADVAKDLCLDEAELRATFSRWLQYPFAARREAIARGEMTELEEARCYAVYRLTKSASAFEMAMRTVERRGGLARRCVRYAEALAPFAAAADMLDRWSGGPPSPAHAYADEMRAARAVLLEERD